MRKLASSLACLGLSIMLLLANDGWAQSQGAPDDAAQAPPAGGSSASPALPSLPKRIKPPVKPITSVPADPDPEIMHFWGTCGASAAVRLNGDRVVIGSDDDNYLRTYDLIEPAALELVGADGTPDPKRSGVHRPRATQDFYPFLQVKELSVRNFSAIEGAARGDGIVYWIASHARRADGETRPNRRRFFATNIVSRMGLEVLVPVGKPVMDLTYKLEADEKIKRSGVRNSMMPQYRKMEHLAPQVRGIDIQGLAMAPDDEAVWIALRNPTRASRAQFVPIENPRALVTGRQPVFGDPFGIVTDRRGISAIEWVPELGQYLLVTAPLGATTGYQLHRWSGDPNQKPSKGEPLPEALDVQSFIVSTDGKRALVFSDDSAVPLPVESQEDCRARLNEDGTCPCGGVVRAGPKRFRARWISLEPAAPEATN